MLQNETLEFNMDCSILWGSNIYDSKEKKEETEENNEYVVIDNPINRIKSVKY